MSLTAERFDPEKWRRLEAPERRARMSPAALAALLAPGPDETVVDIGCGTGYFAEGMSGACRTYVGVDFSAQLLEVFRAKGLPGDIRLVRGLAFPLPLADATADLVFHANLLHEVADPALFHRELFRVTKPGGRLFAIDWEARETEGGPPLAKRISRERAAEAMRRGGLSDLAVHPLWDDWYVLGGRRP
ncbi:MAG: class I SAM-dependent methyltransferase [Nitrospinae bacterium]|nr:class I SAM-dependent methyltransferase [Nitrospinota bacterium]